MFSTTPWPYERPITHVPIVNTGVKKEVEERRGKMHVAKELVCHLQCSINPGLMQVITQYSSSHDRNSEMEKTAENKSGKAEDNLKTTLG
jgi:hypothetical protein